MVASHTLLITSKVSILEITAPDESSQRVCSMPACDVKWRRKQLWVKGLLPDDAPCLPSLRNEEWLTKCLKYSSVNLVCVSPEMGAAGLRRWADVCEKAGKPIFLRPYPGIQRDRQQRGVSAWLIRILNQVAAAGLLVLLGPILLSLMLLLWLDAPDQVFLRQWRVGERGKLFRLIKFRTQPFNRQEDAVRPTGLRAWIQQAKLDKLPQLINVLRGEMYLFGAEPLNLREAIEPHEKQLPALPTPEMLDGLKPYRHAKGSA